MQKQFLALIGAAMLVAAILPYQLAIAQEEETQPTDLEAIVEIVNDEVAIAVEDIIKDDPVLTDAVEATTEEVLNDLDVKPEIIEAVGNVTDDVAAANEPSDVIVTLSENVTTVEVLETIGTVEDTAIVEEVIFAEIADEIIATDTELSAEIGLIVCDIFVDILDGTPVDDAVANVEDDIAVVVEAEVTEEEVADAEVVVTPEEVIEVIETGDADLEEAVGDAVVDELEDTGVITPEPDPTPDPTPGHDSEHQTIIAQNTEIIELQKETNSLLRQLLAAQQNNDD